MERRGDQAVVPPRVDLVLNVQERAVVLYYIYYVWVVVVVGLGWCESVGLDFKRGDYMHTNTHTTKYRQESRTTPESRTWLLARMES